MQLLKNIKNNVSPKTETVIESLAANIIFSVTQGKLLSLGDKHLQLSENLNPKIELWQIDTTNQQIKF